MLLDLIAFAGQGHSISWEQGVRGGAIKQDGIFQFGIVDCVSQAKLTASRLVGVVVDPSGVPVPHANVSITANENARIATVTDSKGRFSLNAPAGEYLLVVKATPFVSAEVGVRLGRDVAGIVHHNDLYVILGLAGSFCPSITTSVKAFRRTVRDNNNRMQESAKKNATQE